MASQYETEFLDAIDRSKRLGYDQGSISTSSFYKKLLVGNCFSSFLELIQIYFDSMQPDQMAGRCLGINLSLQEKLKADLNLKSYYTLGAFEMDGKSSFQFSENDLKEWLKSGVPDFTNLSIHAWLTLESLEIIDITICTTVGVALNDPECIGRIYHHLPEEYTKNLRFHPIIVGSEILPDIGAMQLFRVVS